MVHEPIYLDLSSSSDEDDEDRNRDRNGSTALMYFAKVFHMDVDDEDVRIIDKPSSNGKVKTNKARVVRATLDDDDCCILDTDPGAVDAAPDVVSSLDTDELVMTGEKGPVACRDFPHARYLCVHFPFKSTLHTKFCAQCHCYVCDSLAPCSLWGEGNSPTDHCHASEEPGWKSLRMIAKYGSFTSLAGAADPTREGRLLQTTLLQTLPSCTPPITVVTPVELPGVVPRVTTTVQRDPLVIQLRGKGRGKVSQLPQVLGVKNVRQLGVHRKSYVRKSAPRCLVPRSASPPHSGRPEDDPPLTTPNPDFRLGKAGGRVPTITTPHSEPPLTTPKPNFRPGRLVPATIPPHPRPPHNTLNPNFRLGRAGGGISPTPPPHPQSPLTTPSPNIRLGRPVPSSATPHPRSMRSLNTPRNRAEGGAVAASLPCQGRNSLPRRVKGVARIKPTVQQLPQPTLNPNSTPNDATASYFPPPPPVTNGDLQAPGAEAPSVCAGPQSYVSVCPLKDQQDSNVSIDPLPEDHSSTQPHRPSVVIGSDFVAQVSRIAVDNASSSHGGGAVDNLAGPIEGWEIDAAADFSSFTARGSPERVPSSLNDVIQQMATDDYLWEPPYSGWQ